MKVNTKAEVHCYEINDKDTLGYSKDVQLRVSSHWNVCNLVVIQCPKSRKKYTVSASEIISAIRKCSGD